MQLDAEGKLLVRTPLINDGVYEGAETFNLVATRTDGQFATGVATIKDDGTGDIYTPEGRLNTQAQKDDDRRSLPPVIEPPPVVIPSTLIAYPTSPERWMPHVGEIEFTKRIDHGREDDLSKRTPLRFDSALYPLLNLNSVKDLGLTEPVAQDASQRMAVVEVVETPAKTALVEQPQQHQIRLVAQEVKGSELHLQDKMLGDQKLAVEFRIPKESKQLERKTGLPGRQGLTEKLKHAGNNKHATLSRLS